MSEIKSFKTTDIELASKLQKVYGLEVVESVGVSTYGQKKTYIFAASEEEVAEILEKEKQKEETVKAEETQKPGFVPLKHVLKRGRPRNE